MVTIAGTYADGSSVTETFRVTTDSPGFHSLQIGFFSVAWAFPGMDCEYNMAGAHFDALPGCMQEASLVLSTLRDLVV
jgi:hypothetical protein